MTRQKKEIIKKIEEIEREIEIDMELSHGIHPAGAYDGMGEITGELQEELARLRHYESAEEMMYDTRGIAPDDMLLH